MEARDLLPKRPMTQQESERYFSKPEYYWFLTDEAKEKYDNKEGKHAGTPEES